MTSTDPEFDFPDLPAPLQAAVEWLDAWCQAALQAQEEKDCVAAPLYHYTSTAGLKAIIDSQQLWFTDYRHLNDSKELQLGIEQAHEALRLAQEGADGRVGLFLRMVADLLSLENLDTLAFFVGSFTRSRDDLGQWRAYADNGRGVAIGFAPAMFAVGAVVSPSANENAFIGSVLYDTSAALARHRAAIDAAAAIFQETVDTNVKLLRDKAVGVSFMRLFASPDRGRSGQTSAIEIRSPSFGPSHQPIALLSGVRHWTRRSRWRLSTPATSTTASSA